MNPNSVTIESPLATRIKAWMDERFPFVNALLFFILYLTAAVIARYSSTEGAVSLALIDIVGCLITWSFFLVVRIFDEHKDYELDVLNHPQRVLQSGLITLNHLKGLALAAIALQITYSLILDSVQTTNASAVGPTMFAWLMVFGWTCLMGKEFFCGEWLEKRLTLYAFSHMIVMFFIVWWLVQMGRPSAPLSNEVIALGFLAFISGFAFEITRKTRGPEEERDTVDSYSKIFGAKGAAILVISLVLGMIATQCFIILQVGGAGYWPALVVLAIVLLLCLKSLLSFIAEPTEKGREKNEMAVALGTLLGYLVVLVSVFVNRGITLTLM
ncbi:UbiA family prenyltransferase [Alkalimarinus coralli]|uniref:UbiA family prenyltransferase n=1 Tax=Alkalimarinus coralli TaxID=2935863 RepID=UPI00202B05CE|nr:UbiA family prenyltransferase [Alkalimarinus coralli]